MEDREDREEREEREEGKVNKGRGVRCDWSAISTSGWPHIFCRVISHVSRAGSHATTL